MKTEVISSALTKIPIGDRTYWVQLTTIDNFQNLRLLLSPSQPVTPLDVPPIDITLADLPPEQPCNSDPQCGHCRTCYRALFKEAPDPRSLSGEFG